MEEEVGTTEKGGIKRKKKHKFSREEESSVIIK